MREAVEKQSNMAMVGVQKLMEGLRLGLVAYSLFNACLAFTRLDDMSLNHMVYASFSALATYLVTPRHSEADKLDKG
jgi:hypothetical protein